MAADGWEQGTFTTVIREQRSLAPPLREVVVAVGDGRWVELGEGVLARRYGELDLTVGLVVGEDACLVVDTRGDAGQGAELAAAVRELTSLPWRVVITHAHFDHAFGTAAFLPCEVWAHEGCRAQLTAEGTREREEWARKYREEGNAEIADALARTEIVLPEHVITGTAELDLGGGRHVTLAHPGAGHTGHDLIVHVPDARTVFAGDLVEAGPEGTYTEESFGPDSVLTSWPATLDAIGALEPRIVVPGHGDPAGPDFLARQRESLARLAALAAEPGTGEHALEDVLARSPFPPELTRRALGAAG
jgi:glyoxylase-like metal-dependent hydrolase (beta-lactamase superfamily II)